MKFKITLIISILAAVALLFPSCKASEPALEPTLNVTSEFVVKANYEAQEFEITFETNLAWKAESNKAWLTISQTEGGAGSCVISCNIEENTTFETRNARVTITAGDLKQMVTVSQGNAVPESLSILFIGNSFTQDACAHLPGIVHESGLGPKLTFVDMYWGGALVSQYNAEYSTNTSDFTTHTFLASASTKAYTNRKGLSIQDVVRERFWDIVVIQEHTGNSAAWTWTSTSKKNMDELIAKIKADNGKGVGKTGDPKFYYLMSQAYFDMGKIGSASQGDATKLFQNDQTKMYNVIVDFAQNMVKNCDFVDVIASGTYFQNLRGSSANINKTTYDLTRDGYHMDYGITRYGAACLVFEKLITPLFGTTLDDNKYRYNTPSTDGKIMTPVTDENAPIALKCARAAISEPYKVTKID